MVELAECNVTNSMQTFSVSEDYLLRVDDFCLVKSEVLDSENEVPLQWNELWSKIAIFG